MCIAYPGTVKEVKGLKAIVDYPSSSKQVLIGEKKVKVGDKVLVQMGMIVDIISEKEYAMVYKTWQDLGEMG